jgi:hypothetical protein
MRHFPSLRIIGAIVALILSPMLPIGLVSNDDQPDLGDVVAAFQKIQTADTVVTFSVQESLPTDLPSERPTEIPDNEEFLPKTFEWPVPDSAPMFTLEATYDEEPYVFSFLKPWNRPPPSS